MGRGERANFLGNFRAPRLGTRFDKDWTPVISDNPALVALLVACALIFIFLKPRACAHHVVELAVHILSYVKSKAVSRPVRSLRWKPRTSLS